MARLKTLMKRTKTSISTFLFVNFVDRNELKLINVYNVQLVYSLRHKFVVRQFYQYLHRLGHVNRYFRIKFYKK